MINSPLTRILCGVGGLGGIGTIVVVKSLPKDISYDEYVKEVETKCGVHPKSFYKDDPKYKKVFDSEEKWKECHDSILNKVRGYREYMESEKKAK